MNKNKETLVAMIVLIVVELVSAVGASILSGYVLATMWAWFVVTSLHVAPLSLPAAIGIGMMVRYLTYKNPAEDKEDPDFGKMIIMWYTLPLAALFGGWVVTLFM